MNGVVVAGLALSGCAGSAEAPDGVDPDRAAADRAAADRVAPSVEQALVDPSRPPSARVDDRLRTPVGSPTGSSYLASVTCPSGQSDCGGACQATGASCTVGVGACANSGTVVCGAGTPDLAAGASSACALGAGGTVQCWGANAYGTLGDGTTVTRPSPVAVRGLRDATAVAVGFGHACALLADATVRCWGRNNQGQLGDGTTTQRLTPVAVSGLTGVTRIVANGYSTCALLTDGTARCWGLNANGQLGDGTTTRRLAPVPVAGLAGATGLAAGASHACALLADGTAQCWGLNSNGQVGDGTTVQRLVPTTVTGVAGATAVVAGAAFTCALGPGGAASCWGQNSSGQLGDGTTTRRLVRVAVAGLAGATQLAAGAAHTCATLADGTARCWGANAYGQLGDGTILTRTTPVAVSGPAGVVKVVAADRSTCALLTGGAAQCWGDGASGQLGDGGNVARPTPGAVVGLDAGTTCSALAGAPSAEVCDGVDNDCNGVVDDVAPTACAPGACATRGHLSCGAGPGFPTICVADVLRAAGFVCRAAVAGGCDVAESCDGVSAACPADVVQGAGTLCRASGGVCDAAEVCTGSSNACPADAVQAAGTVCRPAAAGGCDVAEACNGVAKTCPTDRFLTASTVCRPAAGPCDAPETCRGTSSACPADALRPSTYTCRPAVAGGCDVAELCTGGGIACPADAVRLAGTTCRAALSGGCDVAEVCDGSANVCPANVVRPAGTACRAANGVCDVAEACNGVSGSCPADAFLPVTVVCRAAVGDCDAAETCTGASRSCPANALRPAGATCRDAVGPCDVAEVCNGASTACPAAVIAAAGTVCRAATGDCDAAEVCDGAATSCPADAPAADHTACEDGDPCTRADACTAGACVGGALQDCDDGNACTADACGATCQHTPIAGCGSSVAAILVPPDPPVDTAAATQESSGVALIDPAGVVAPGAFGASGLALSAVEVRGLVAGWEFSPAGALASPVAVRVPLDAAPNGLYAVVGRVGGTWQVESVARVTADGTHAVASLSRLGQHALVQLPGCDAPRGAQSPGGGTVGEPQQWAPNSPVVSSESGNTWAWLTQGVFIHVGSQDYFVEEGPRTADEDGVRMSGNGTWLAYLREGIRRYNVSTLHFGDESLGFTTVAVPEGPEGPWQYDALAMSWDGQRMVFIARHPVTDRSDLFLWEGGTAVRPLTSTDGREGSLAINGSVREVALSADGRWMSFVTDATDVLPSFSEAGGVYLRDLQTGDTTLVAPAGSVRSAGASVSRSGRLVAWLAPPDGDDGNNRLRVWDRATGARRDVNVDADGTSRWVDQWSMSNDGVRFVFSTPDWENVEVGVRTRWLGAASSTPLYTGRVSPLFGEVTGERPVITGGGDYVFSSESGHSNTPARVVWRHRVPTEPISGSARAAPGDRWEYEPFRAEWSGFSPFNARVAFAWEPATGFSTPVPMVGDAGDAEVAARLPLGRHPLVTVQSFEGGDGVGVCVTQTDFQVARARVRMLEGTGSSSYPNLTPRFEAPLYLQPWGGPYRLSPGARHLIPYRAWEQDAGLDDTLSFRRFDRRDGNRQIERIEGLSIERGPHTGPSSGTAVMNPSNRRAFLEVADTSTVPATSTKYFIDLASRAVTATYPDQTYVSGFATDVRLSDDGATAIGRYVDPTDDVIVAWQSPVAPFDVFRRTRLGGHDLPSYSAVPVHEGMQVIFQERIVRGTNPRYERSELRRWNRDLANETLLLSWPERLDQNYSNQCMSASAPLAQLASDGRWVTFCGPTPGGFPAVPAVECLGAQGARWLYDIDNNVLRQLSDVCVEDATHPPVFARDSALLVYLDPVVGGGSNVVVYDLGLQVARVAVSGAGEVRDLFVNLGGTHAAFTTNSRAYVESHGLTWPSETTTTAAVLAPLQDEYLGAVIPEAP